jgi:ribosome recycling factor
MDSLDDVLLDAEEKMEKTIHVMQEQFMGMRTGKASPALVENVRVPYYGTPTRLREIAGISTPEPRLIVINAYDPTALPDIERAILAQNLGVTPINDGRIIRVPIPELSQERREEIKKVIRRIAEENRVAIRNIRRDANEAVKKLQKDGKVSEDDRDAGLTQVQALTDQYTGKVDEMLANKEREIMVV